MAALTESRKVKLRAGDLFSRKMKTGVQLFSGSIVMLDSNGLAVPATATTGLVPDGVARGEMTSTGTEVVEVAKGILTVNNSTTNAIGLADIGSQAYAEDDNTVGNVSTGLSAVGIIVDVDGDDVWVKFI